MADTEKIISYLSSSAFQEAAAGKGTLEPAPFITISRQAGIGGSAMGRAIIAEMAKTREPLLEGWHVFDREICELVAKDPKLSVFLDSLEREEFRSEFADYISRFFTNDSPQFVVMRRIFRAIRAVAKVGKAVIVGRAGCCVTRDLPLGIHVRLVAPKRARLAAIADRYGLDKAQGERRLKEWDDSRAALVRTYFRGDIDDPLLYDAVWNTETVAFEEIASILVKMVQDKSRQVRGAAYAR